MKDLQILLGQHRGDHLRQVTQWIELEDKNIPFSISWVTLSPKNPLFERLLAKPSLAEVPRARFSEPILTVYRSDNLLAEGELDDVLKSVGMVEPLNHKAQSKRRLTSRSPKHQHGSFLAGRTGYDSHRQHEISL